MNIITGQQAKELYKEFLSYCKHAICECEIKITLDNVVAVEHEKNINGQDVETIDFFCSSQCASEFIEEMECKRNSGIFSNIRA